MSHVLQAFQSEVQAMRASGAGTEEAVLDLTLEVYRENGQRALEQAVWYCAVPRWFNLDIVDAMRPHKGNTLPAQSLLGEMTQLPFVRPFPPYGYAFREAVRDVLLQRWRNGNSESFQAWNARALAYFERRLAATTTSRDLDNRTRSQEILPEAERLQYQRERLYHLMVVDPIAGFQEFQDLFRLAERNRQFSQMQALLVDVEGQENQLDSYRKDYITYYHGVLDLQADRRDQARQTFQDLLTTITPSRLRTKLLYRMGMLEANEGRFDAAIYYYGQSLRECEVHQTCTQWEYARIHKDLGNAYARSRKWESAVQHLEQSLAIWQAIDDKLGVVETYNDLGNTFQQQRLPDQAEQYYLQGLDLLRRAEVTWRVARVYNNLGAFYGGQGKWDKASLYFNQSLEVKSELGDRSGIATTYNNMANVLVRRGEVERITQPLQQALQHYGNSLRIFRELGDRLGMANTLYNLAYVHRRLGHWDQALSCVDESLSLYQSLGSEEIQEATELRHQIVRQT